MVYQIDDSTAVLSQPTLPTDNVGSPGYFTDGSPANGEGATYVPAWWLNMVQNELVEVCHRAGISLDKTNNAQLAEAIFTLLSTSTNDKVNRAGDNLTGALFSTGTFSPSSNVYTTQPIGASLEGEQFYLQLINDNTKGETCGRLVLRDGGGNYHIPLQVDNHDAVTTNGDLTVTGKTTHQGAVLSTGTYNTATNIYATQPLGAAMGDMQFYVQLVNDNTTSTTHGQLILKDGGGHYHVALQIDNQGNVTDQNGQPLLNTVQAQEAYYPLTGGELKGDLNGKGTILSTGTFNQSDNVYASYPIGAALDGEQFYLQLVNDNTKGETYGRLVLRDGGGNYHIPLQVDNHDAVTTNGDLTVTGQTIHQGPVLSTGTFNPSTSLTQTQPIGAALEDIQFYLQLVNDTTDNTTSGRLVLRDGGGNFHVPLHVDNHDNTTLNGNLTVTGPASLLGAQYDGIYYGGECKSMVPGATANATLQLQGSNGNETAALLLQDNAGNWRNWGFHIDGSLTAPSGNALPEIMGGGGRKVIQTFLATTEQVSSGTISFPTAFKPGTQPFVFLSPVTEHGSNQSSISEVRQNKDGSLQITNTGFNFYRITGAQPSTYSYTIPVLAIGEMQ